MSEFVTVAIGSMSNIQDPEARIQVYQVEKVSVICLMLHTCNSVAF